MSSEKIWWIKPLPGNWQNTAEKRSLHFGKETDTSQHFPTIFFLRGLLTKLFLISPNSVTGNNCCSDFTFIRGQCVHVCVSTCAHMHFCRTETSWSTAGAHLGASCYPTIWASNDVPSPGFRGLTGWHSHPHHQHTASVFLSPPIPVWAWN